MGVALRPGRLRDPADHVLRAPLVVHDIDIVGRVLRVAGYDVLALGGKRERCGDELLGAAGKNTSCVKSSLGETRLCCQTLRGRLVPSTKSSRLPVLVPPGRCGHTAPHARAADISVYVEAGRQAGGRDAAARARDPFVLRTAVRHRPSAEGRRVTGWSGCKRVVIALDNEGRGDLFLVIHLMIAGRLRWLPPAHKPAKSACWRSSSMPARWC